MLHRVLRWLGRLRPARPPSAPRVATRGAAAPDRNPAAGPARRAGPGALLSLGLALVACDGRDRSGCPAELEAFGAEEGRAGRLESLPHPRCVLSEEELARYRRARHAALAEYCAPERAFEVGRRGGERDLAACTADARSRAEQALRIGTELGEAERQLAVKAEAAAELERRARAAPEAEREALLRRASELRLEARAAENAVELARGAAQIRGFLPSEVPGGLQVAPDAE